MKAIIKVDETTMPRSARKQLSASELLLLLLTFGLGSSETRQANISASACEFVSSRSPKTAFDKTITALANNHGFAA